MVHFRADSILLDRAREWLQAAEAMVTPLVVQFTELAQPWVNIAQPHVEQHLARLEASLHSYTHAQVALVCIAATACAAWLISIVMHWWQGVSDDGGLVPAMFAVIRSLPGVRGYIASEQRELRRKLLAGRHSNIKPMTKLPPAGLPASAVMSLLSKQAEQDIKTAPGDSRLSGALYMCDPAHRDLLDRTFTLFAHTNPLHPSVWPSVRQMEAEVVSMTAELLGGGSNNPEVCGALTSGGTESILLAMKASRDWARARYGIRRPELIIAQSAHPAYIKAASYFGMRLVVLPVGCDLRLSARAVQRALTRNTAVVVASSPSFPHGVIDDVAGIAKVCKRAGVCLHVDGCLGGFVLPFLVKLGHKLPPFDFSVPGVTSMSVDTHKFGQAHKGSSVVLFDRAELRACQYTSCTDWTGGLYISPSMAGSRNGALIATAWAALVHVGEDGYMKITKQLFDLTTKFIEGLNTIPELELLGKPDMCLVAFQCSSQYQKKINIWKLNDWLTGRGWHLNALQLPPAIHICFTPAHVGGKQCVAGLLLDDLRMGIAALLDSNEPPAAADGGSAPMYGMAAGIPDRKLVGQFLHAFQDVQLAA